MWSDGYYFSTVDVNVRMQAVPLDALQLREQVEHESAANWTAEDTMTGHNAQAVQNVLRSTLISHQLHPGARAG